MADGDAVASDGASYSRLRSSLNGSLAHPSDRGYIQPMEPWIALVRVDLEPVGMVL